MKIEERLKEHEKRIRDLEEKAGLIEESEEDAMTKEEAKAYLKRKGRSLSKESIEQVCKEGKIYGDPFVELK